MDETGFRMFQLSSAGYCCAQIMMKMALEDEETENEDLIRALNGLCMGIGSEQKTCGVLTGGITVLGLYAGKGNDREYPSPAIPRWWMNLPNGSAKSSVARNAQT